MQSEDSGESASPGTGATSDVASTPSTSKVSSLTRIQRNVAEKQRRDKLNGYISELANIVPMVSMSSKRLDKTSILRLSAAHLRLSKSPLSGKKKLKKSFNWCPSFLTGKQVREILESVDGFLLVTTTSGKILFTSRSVERYLGYQDIDLIGHSLFMFIHPDDLDAVKEELERLLNLSLKGEAKSPPRCSFRCRMKEKGQPRSEVVTYLCVHFAGDMTVFEEEDSVSKINKNTATSHIFKAFVKIVDTSLYNELSLEEATADEYVTRHSLDGTIIFADHRLSTITGHLPQEVIGCSAYKYIIPEDISVTLFAHHLMFSSDKGTGLIVYRLRTRDDKYVYLKTVGCLQFDRATSQVDHFVCVNQHLSESEGETQLKYFIERFIPHLKENSALSLLESVKALQSNGMKTTNSMNISETTYNRLSTSEISKFNYDSLTAGCKNKSVSNSENIQNSVSKKVKYSDNLKPADCSNKSNDITAGKYPASFATQNKNVVESVTLKVTSEANPLLNFDKSLKYNNSKQEINKDYCNTKTSSKSRTKCVVSNSVSLKSSSEPSINELNKEQINSINVSGTEDTTTYSEMCNSPSAVVDALVKSNVYLASSNSNIHAENHSLGKDGVQVAFVSQNIPSVDHKENLPNSQKEGDLDARCFNNTGSLKTSRTHTEHLPSPLKIAILKDSHSQSESSTDTDELLCQEKAFIVKREISSGASQSYINKYIYTKEISSDVSTMWPVETSSESSRSNTTVNEDTYTSPLESCDDMFFVSDNDMKDCLVASDDISSILESTLPFEDSSMASADGWNEYFTPGNILSSPSSQVPFHKEDDPSLNQFEDKSLNL